MDINATHDFGGTLHAITITEPKGPGTPNFRVICACGRKINVASVNKTFVENVAIGHLVSEKEAWLCSLEDSEEQVSEEDFDSPRSPFADPDFRADMRGDRGDR